jgi:hypothetical protein
MTKVLLAFPGHCGKYKHKQFHKWHKKKKKKKKKKTLHIDSWRNVRVWVDFFGGLHLWQSHDIREINVTIRSDI